MPSSGGDERWFVWAIGLLGTSTLGLYGWFARLQARAVRRDEMDKAWAEMAKFSGQIANLRTEMAVLRTVAEATRVVSVDTARQVSGISRTLALIQGGLAKRQPDHD